MQVWEIERARARILPAVMSDEDGMPMMARASEPEVATRKARASSTQAPDDVISGLAPRVLRGV